MVRTDAALWGPVEGDMSNAQRSQEQLTGGGGSWQELRKCQMAGGMLKMGGLLSSGGWDVVKIVAGSSEDVWAGGAETGLQKCESGRRGCWEWVRLCVRVAGMGRGSSLAMLVLRWVGPGVSRARSRLISKRAHPDLNQEPADLQSVALTTDLCTPCMSFTLTFTAQLLKTTHAAGQRASSQRPASRQPTNDNFYVMQQSSIRSRSRLSSGPL